MFKIVNTLLLIGLLTACSSQEDKKSSETNSTKVQERAKKATVEKATVKEASIEKTEPQSQKEDATVQKSITTNDKDSLFTLTTLEGKTIHIDETEGGLKFKEYKDKVVLLLFFGHNCPPCLREIPVLKALVNKGHKDLEIIAIEVQGYNQEQLKAFKKYKGINYHLVSNTSNSEFVNYIAKQTQWSGSIPFLIGFNKQSIVKVVHAGGLRASDFDNIYTTLAKKD